METPITVYNFEVEDFHTYYVSDSAVLVHNVCGPKSQITYDTRKQAFNAAKQEILGHTFGDGSSIGRHFNTSTGLHIFY